MTLFTPKRLEVTTAAVVAAPHLPTTAAVATLRHLRRRLHRETIAAVAAAPHLLTTAAVETLRHLRKLLNRLTTAAVDQVPPRRLTATAVAGEELRNQLWKVRAMLSAKAITALITTRTTTPITMMNRLRHRR